MTITLIRTITLYFILIFAVRLMGKRQVAEMEPAEFVVTMLVANLAAVPMQDSALPLVSGMLPILTILALELILAVLSIRFIPLRKLLCGRPALLIHDGVVDQKALISSRVSMDELTEKLREKDVFDLTTVRHAILETDGELSVMLYPEYQTLTTGQYGASISGTDLPYTIISDGVLIRDNLIKSGFNEEWLEKTLQSHGCSTDEVFLLTVEQNGKTYFIRKDLS